MIAFALKSRIIKVYSNLAFKITEFILVNLFILLGVLFIFIIDPLKHKIFPDCYILSTTGLYCPGCGMTRSLHSILHGEFIQAGRYNLMVFIIIGICIIFYVLYFGWRFFNLNILSKIDIKPQYVFGFLIVMFLYFILRNLPFAPFNYFVP